MGDGAQDALKAQIRGGLPTTPGSGRRQVFCCTECGEHKRGARGVMRHQIDQHGVHWPKSYTNQDFDPPMSVWDGWAEPVGVYLMDDDPESGFFRFGHTHNDAILEVTLLNGRPEIRLQDGADNLLVQEVVDVDLSMGRLSGMNAYTDKKPGYRIRDEDVSDRNAHVDIRADDGKTGGWGIRCFDDNGHLVADRRVKPNEIVPRPVPNFDM